MCVTGRVQPGRRRDRTGRTVCDQRGVEPGVGVEQLHHHVQYGKLHDYPLAASVTPNAASKVYGSGDPALTGTLNGFLAADGVTVAYSRAAEKTVMADPTRSTPCWSPRVYWQLCDHVQHGELHDHLRSPNCNPNNASEFMDCHPAFLALTRDCERRHVRQSQRDTVVSSAAANSATGTISISVNGVTRVTTVLRCQRHAHGDTGRLTVTAS